MFPIYILYIFNQSKVPRSRVGMTGCLGLVIFGSLESCQDDQKWNRSYSLPWKFNIHIAPENGWLEDDCFLFESWPILRGYVSFR